MNSVYDVAVHAENLGYHYNDVIVMMETAGIIPFYEQKSLDAYKGVGRDYGWGDALTSIFDSYVDEHGRQELSD